MPKVKYVDKNGDFTPEYCQYLYDRELEDMENNKRLGSDKWKNDLLLILLMKAKGSSLPRKKLRRKIVQDVKKECRIALRSLSIA